MNFGLEVGRLCSEAAKHHSPETTRFWWGEAPVDPMLSTKVPACLMPTSRYAGTCAEPRVCRMAADNRSALS